MKTIDKFRHTEKFCISGHTRDIWAIGKYFDADTVTSIAYDSGYEAEMQKKFGDDVIHGIFYTVRVVSLDGEGMKDHLIRVDGLDRVHIIETKIIYQKPT